MTLSTPVFIENKLKINDILSGIHKAGIWSRNYNAVTDEVALRFM
jgi:hypothetical protein